MPIQLSPESFTDNSRFIFVGWGIGDTLIIDSNDGAKLLEDLIVERWNGSNEIFEDVNAEWYL